MNIHNKLKSLGFKKTQIHRTEWHSTESRRTMVPDVERRETKYVPGTFKSESVMVRIVHPKGDSFYKLSYGDNFILWASVKNHTLDSMWVETINFKSGQRLYGRNDTSGDGLKLVYDVNDRDTVHVKGSNEIIDVLPTALRRDFLLSKLFD